MLVLELFTEVIQFGQEGLVPLVCKGRMPSMEHFLQFGIFQFQKLPDVEIVLSYELELDVYVSLSIPVFLAMERFDSP